MEGLGVVAGVAHIPILHGLQLCLPGGDGPLECCHLCSLVYADGTTPARDLLSGLQATGCLVVLQYVWKGWV